MTFFSLFQVRCTVWGAELFPGLKAHTNIPTLYTGAFLPSPSMDPSATASRLSSPSPRPDTAIPSENFHYRNR